MCGGGGGAAVGTTDSCWHQSDLFMCSCTLLIYRNQPNEGLLAVRAATHTVGFGAAAIDISNQSMLHEWHRHKRVWLSQLLSELLEICSNHSEIA